MKKRRTSSWFLILSSLLLGSGCAPKAYFDFSLPSSVQAERDAGPSTSIAQDVPVEPLPSNEVLTAATVPEPVLLNKSWAAPTPPKSIKKPRPGGTSTVLQKKKQHKQFRSKEEPQVQENLPAHKLVAISLFFSALGLITALLAPAALYGGAGLLLLLSFSSSLAGAILGQIALTKIRKNPEKFSGKTAATVSLVMGLAGMALWVAAYFYLISVL